MVSNVIGSLTNVTLLDRPASARALVSAVRNGHSRPNTPVPDTRATPGLGYAGVAARTGRELQNADRRKDEFLAMLAHELRNPLAPIRNASELLARTLPVENAVPNVGRDMRKRQVTPPFARLVDDLLDVSRITRGRIELQLQRSVELAEIINKAIESVEPADARETSRAERFDRIRDLCRRGRQRARSFNASSTCSPTRRSTRIRMAGSTSKCTV